MSFLVELILEVVAYQVGRAIASVFLPHLKIEPVTQAKSLTLRDWLKVTYQRGSQRFLYIEAVQLLGFVSLLLLFVFVTIMVRYAR